MNVVALVALAACSMIVDAPVSNSPSVIVGQPDESKFPEITVYFELKRPDGTFVLDAKPEEFRVTEDDKARPVFRFEAPLATEVRPTTLVLVVDRSKSMLWDDRIGTLKRSVAGFLKGLPKGSRVAVVSFSAKIEVACEFTTDHARALEAVNALEVDDGTYYYDAVAVALEMLGKQSGRRAVLALTDGEDNRSLENDLASVTHRARELGLPVHTLGLGNEEEIAVADLAQLAEDTRGQHYLAKDADRLRKIYEEIARRLGNSYSLTYSTDHKLPDGTLRPIRISYEKGDQNLSGETSIFVRGMVVPAAGWPGLFLGLLASLLILSRLPRRFL